MNPAEFLLDLANGNMNEKSIPLHLEHTLSPTNSTCRPSQMEVHKVIKLVMINIDFLSICNMSDYI